MALSVGTRLGPYEITAALGAGGMGEVYRARDPRLGRDVALKILSPEFVSDPERHARFEREARLISQLNHANICALYHIGCVGVFVSVRTRFLHRSAPAGWARCIAPAIRN